MEACALILNIKRNKNFSAESYRGDIFYKFNLFKKQLKWSPGERISLHLSGNEINNSFGLFYLLLNTCIAVIKLYWGFLIANHSGVSKPLQTGIIFSMDLNHSVSIKALSCTLIRLEGSALLNTDSGPYSNGILNDMKDIYCYYKPSLQAHLAPYISHFNNPWIKKVFIEELQACTQSLEGTVFLTTDLTENLERDASIIFFQPHFFLLFACLFCFV